MRVRARHGGFSSGGGSRPFRSAALGVGLICLVGAAFGCNSDSPGDGATQQLARARHSADGGTFRNLGKRSAFDYRSVEPEAAAQH